MLKKFFVPILFFAVLMGLNFQQVLAVQAPGNDQHQLLNLQLAAGREITVPVSKPFEAFAMSEVEGVEVRFLQAKVWTDWQHLELEEEDISGSELRFVAPTMAFAIRASRDISMEVTMIRIIDMPVQLAMSNDLALDVGLGSAGDSDQLAAVPKIISRQEWGADESLGVYHPESKPDSGVESTDAEGPSSVNICAPLEREYPGQYQVSDKEVETNERGETLVWPRQYSANVKKIVIHHTAESVRDFDGDGRIDSRDYRTATQAIYVYHTLTRHWGDIGYHYLVDPDGNIYEGRAGGKAVIGAQVLCQNSNTVGVSVMGNFDKQVLPEKAFVGLVKIVKYLSDIYAVNPMGKSAFRGEVLPNIVTHGEVGAVTAAAIGKGATKCPGDSLKTAMPRLRQVVAAGGIKPDYGFNIVSVPKNLTLDPLQTLTATVRLKNIGEQSWSKVELSTGLGKSSFVSKDMMVVPSEQETELSIPLTADLEGGTTRLSFIVQLDGLRQKKKVEFVYKVNKPIYRYELVNFDGRQDAILVGEKRTLDLKLKNTGNFPWLAKGKDKFQLQQVSRGDDGVESYSGGLNYLLTETVPVGADVNFSVDLPVQQRPGLVTLELIPVVAGTKGLKGGEIAVSAHVETPKFDVVIAPADRKVRVEKGFTSTVDFQIVNKSNFDWESGMVWYQIGRGERQLIAQPLERGKSVLFPITVTAGYDDRSVEVNGNIGVDRLPSKVVVKNFKKAILPFKESVQATGSVRLSAEKVNQSRELLPNEKGQYQEFVEFKNTSTVPWYREGKDRITLEVQGKPDFGRLGILDQELVKPGEVGKFLITLKIISVPRKTASDDFVLKVGERTVKMKGKVKFSVEVKGTRESSENTQASESNVQKIPVMRVLLTEALQDEFQISSPGTFVFWDSKTVQIREQTSAKVATVRSSDLKDGVIIRVKAKDAPYLQFNNWDREKVFGSQRYNDNRYRGVLEFRLIDQKMTVINELPLEDYMKGIAEVPETDDQPTEKRKVIAVLSRSYALHYLISGYEKFPGQPYNAADSPAIFQKYLGYSFEERSPKWQQVLIDTDGEVVKVGDDVLRAAYFSCTDGPRTKTPAEAGWKDAYFTKFADVFQSVDDPLGDDPTRSGLQACGHQVGLSGYGATQMAKNGQKYRDIIQYYYQGVDIRQAQSL